LSCAGRRTTRTSGRLWCRRGGGFCFGFHEFRSFSIRPAVTAIAQRFFLTAFIFLVYRTLLNQLFRRLLEQRHVSDFGQQFVKSLLASIRLLGEHLQDHPVHFRRHVLVE
jgi:hypothetical protein